MALDTISSTYIAVELSYAASYFFNFTKIYCAHVLSYTVAINSPLAFILNTNPVVAYTRIRASSDR